MPRTRNEKSAKAKAKAVEYGGKPLCRNLPRPVPQLPPEVAADPPRARRSSRPWKMGQQDGPALLLLHGNSHYAVPKAQADAIRKAFAKWKAVGIGLEFQEVKQLSEAEVRIGYSEADGSRRRRSAATCCRSR